MATIEKKSWPEYFEKVRRKRRNFDMRLDDFDVREGDVYILREYDPVRKKYTGRVLRRRVGDVMKFKPYAVPFYLDEDIEKKGLQVISLEFSDEDAPA